MKKLLCKMVVIGVPIMLLSLFTFLALQYSREKRIMIFLLVFSTTLLTLSSVAGYYFVKMFLGVALSFGVNLKGRTMALVFAVISFGISYGSGALLSYLLGRI